jgi:uncharacterized membrane protein
MRKAFYPVFVTLSIAWAIFPWVIFSIDLASWILSGGRFFQIDYANVSAESGGRFGVMLVWPIFWTWALGWVGSQIFD